MILYAALAALLQVATPPGAVAGTVRDGTAGRALADVQVVEAGGAATLSDSAGHYRLSGLGPGSHQLRFVRTGYLPLDLGVLLPEGQAETQVDVELTAQPVQLPTVQVVAAAPPPVAAGPPPTAPELGRSTLAEDWMDLRLAGDGDVQQALADQAGPQGRGEHPAGLHVRGGATSDNLVLLDGIPLYSAMHFAGASSAVNPDAILGAELHAGVSPARFGDHLAGVVEVETRDAGPQAFDARGALVDGEVRQTVAGYVPALHTGLVLGARTTYRDALMREAYGGSRNGYQDLLGVATTSAFGGRLRFVSFTSANQLGFPAAADSAGEDYTAAGRNAIDWRSHSQGVTWSRADGRGAKLEGAAWWAGSAADITWRAADGPAQAESRLSELGLSARAAWPSADGGTGIGASLVRPSARYAVTPLAVGSSRSLVLDAAPSIGSVFVDRLWRPSAALSVAAGLRASTDFAAWAALEPRLTSTLEFGRTRLGLGVGRTHQVLQSALNDESALGPLLGLDLPVAAGAGGGALPVARADQAEALVARRVGGALEFSLTGYLRRSAGLALGALSTRGLFVGDSLVVGRGEASGVTAAVDLDAGRLTGRASATVARDVRTAGPLQYDASYGHGTSVTLDLGYRFLEDTRLQLRFRGGARQPTSIIAPGFEYQPLQPLRESGELAGTPENLPGAVNGETLPTYARLDLGLRRGWHVPGLGRETRLVTALSVSNVLGRTNVLGFVAQPGGSLRLLRGSPRAIALEVGWRF